MTDLPISPFMHAANIHLTDGSITLPEVVAEFRKLEKEDQRLRFGQLSLRKKQVNDHLINLLFAIGEILGCQRPKTFRQLEKDWQKRDKDALTAENMLAILCEQFAH
ncbi:MAG: hypothetical protein ACK4SL_04480 [Candidatus Paceibacteria bacterium]